MSEHYDPFTGKNQGVKNTDPLMNESNKTQKSAPSQGIKREEVFPSDQGHYEPSSHYIPKRKERISPFISAGFWIRLLAFIIDTIIASAFSSIFSSPIIALLGYPDNWVATGIHGFFYFLYFILASRFTNGQSIGKMITGLRVIHKTEDTLSWPTIIIREFCGRLIQNAFPILYVIVAFTPLKQGLADMLCDTYVVKEDLYAIEKDQPELFYSYV